MFKVRETFLVSYRVEVETEQRFGFVTLSTTNGLTNTKIYQAISEEININGGLEEGMSYTSYIIDVKRL